MADIDHKPDATVKDKNAAAPNDALHQGMNGPEVTKRGDTAPSAGAAPESEKAKDNAYKTISDLKFQAFLDTTNVGNLVIEPPKGMDAASAIGHVSDFAKATGEVTTLRFQNVHDFSDISLTVKPDSQPADLAKEYATRDAELVSLQSEIAPGYFDQYPIGRGGLVTGGQNPDGSGVNIFDAGFNGAASVTDTTAVDRVSRSAVITTLFTADGTKVSPLYDRAGNVGQLTVSQKDGTQYTLTRQGDPDGNDWVDSRNPGQIRHLEVEAHDRHRPRNTAEIGVRDLDNPADSSFFGTNGKSTPEAVFGGRDPRQPVRSESEGLRGAGSMQDVGVKERTGAVSTEQVVGALDSPEQLRALASRIEDPRLRDAVEKIADIDLKPAQVPVAKDFLMKYGGRVGGAAVVLAALTGLAIWARQSSEESTAPPTFEQH